MILSPARQKMDDGKMCSSNNNSDTNVDGAAGGSQHQPQQRSGSLFGSLKRDRSQRSNTSLSGSLSGSHRSLSGFLNDARAVAVASCNAVFSEFGHSPTNGTSRRGSSGLSPFGTAATSSLAFFSAGEPSVPSAGPTATAGSTGSPYHQKEQQQDAAMANQQQQHVPTKEVVREQLHRASDGIFLSTDTSRRKSSLTAPPPRKGRRRMSDEDDEGEKIVWNGNGSKYQQQFMPKVMSSPALAQFDVAHSHVLLSSVPPLSDSAAAATAAAAAAMAGGGGGMSLSDGEDAVMEFLQKHSVPAPMPSTTPMNSPSDSNVKRVHSMPALAAHTHDANIEEDGGGATTTTDVSVPPDTNPDEYLRTIMGGMGYPTEPVDTLSVPNFFHEHTPEQIAAYDNETCGAARSDDLDALRALHRTGKTLQCSNRFGESLIHIACRRGSLPVIAFLLDEAGVSIRVRDDCGRTPLHVS